MAKAASYIEKMVQGLTKAIGVIKVGKRLTGKDKELASRLGQHATTAEASEEMLADLTTMKEMFDNIGSYPDLVASAQMWDGETKLDPVGIALERGRKEREKYEDEKSLNREDWEEKQVSDADLSGMGMLSFSLTKRERGVIEGFQLVDAANYVEISNKAVYEGSIKEVKVIVKEAINKLKTNQNKPE